MLRKLLKETHRHLVSNQWTRKHQRKLVRFAKALFGVQDAYGDLLRMSRERKALAILDIGAFRGETVCRFLDETNLPVFAFEPSPEAATELASRFSKTERVFVEQLALGDQRGHSDFYVNANQQTNSLLRSDQDKVSFESAMQNKKVIQVPVEKLDSWVFDNQLKGCLVVKADVQGAELKLVEGGSATFKNQVCAFYSEVQLDLMYERQSNFASLNDKLVNLGFYLAEIYQGMKDENGRLVQTDMLWLNSRFD